MTVLLFLAEGFEEIEAVAPIDIFRRADVKVTTVSVASDKIVTGAHGIAIVADKLFEEIDLSGENLLFLPGGMPGTTNLDKHEGLRNLILSHAENGKSIAAICAAPSILGKLDLLKGKEAICYPGFEGQLSGAEISESAVVKSGSIYTAKAAGVAIDFALRIVEDIKGVEVAQKIAKAISLS